MYESDHYRIRCFGLSCLVLEHATESVRPLTTSTEHCGARVYLGNYCLVLSPQLLIPPHSMQAEASGGTIFTSLRIPANLRGLRSTFDPVQE